MRPSVEIHRAPFRVTRLTGQVGKVMLLQERRVGEGAHDTGAIRG